MPKDLLPTLRAFGLRAQGARAKRWGRGHIHDSWRVRLGAEADGAGRSLLLQQLNDRVFPDPRLVATTIARVTRHLRARRGARGEDDLARRVLTLRLTRGGEPCHRDAEGRWWRLFDFIEGARSHHVATTPARAHAAAHAFGEFLHDLEDLPPPPLPATLPGFHDTPARFRALQEAVARDALGRAGGAAAEIDFALAREALARVLHDAHTAGAVPEVVAHNDAKIDNVLFDASSGEALCIVDLDTVMPGLRLYDFGDLVRSGTCPEPEDACEPERMHADPTRFEALVAGFAAGLGGTLCPGERDLLVEAGQVITFEVGLRFLTDHIEGDRYFPVRHEGHNLERGQAQFALLRSLEAQASSWRRLARGA